MFTLAVKGSLILLLLAVTGGDGDSADYHCVVVIITIIINPFTALMSLENDQ